EAGRPVELQTRKPVESTVLVAGIFRPPTLNTPTLGEPPRNVASASNETPFPLTTVMPRYTPLARDNGIWLVVARSDGRGAEPAVSLGVDLRLSPTFRNRIADVRCPPADARLGPRDRETLS